MAIYGVTPYGFVKKTINVLLDEFDAEIRVKFPEFNLNSDGVHGQILQTQMNGFAENWDVLDGTYNSLRVTSAEGNQLDDIGYLTAIGRTPATPAEVIVSCSGTISTLIPEGSLVQRENTQIQFASAIAAALDNTKTSRINLTVSTLADLTDYIILIDGYTITVTSDASATANEIAILLVNAINAQTDIIKVNADYIDANGKFYIIANDLETAFEATLDAKLTLDKFWTPIQFFSIDTGVIEAPAETVNIIITPVAGWSEALNFADGDPGQDINTDIVYRQRLFDEVRRLGGGALEAIAYRLLETVPNIISVAGFENDTMITDIEGRPPKSIEMLVEGGIDSDIAQALWEAKSGGIETFGSESETIKDKWGNDRIIKFSRPEKIYVWFKLTLTTDSDYPLNGDDLVKQGIVSTGVSNFGIGSLLLIQQFYCPIYAVEGVTNALVEMNITTDPLVPPVSYLTTNIQLTSSQIPFFDVSRVDII